MPELKNRTKSLILKRVSLTLFFCLVTNLAFAANSKPKVGTISPSSGISYSNQQVNFTTTYSDADGWQNIQYVYLLINTSTKGANCFFGYYNQNTHKLYLRNDANKSWLGGYAPGSTNTIENSYAKLNCASTTISGAGNTLTVNWSVTFKPTFLGTKNTYLYVKDDAGAYSGWIKKGTWTIKVDTTPPQGTIKINNDAIYTNSTQVTLNLSATDSESGMGTGSQMQFSNDNTNWSTPEAYATTKAWTLSSGDGTKTVYAKFEDSAGNWSTAYSDTIVLDTTPPTTADSGIDGLWHNSSVTITLTASDSGSGIDKTYYSTDGSNPTIIYTSPFSLTNDGTYTIKYYSQDKAGNSEAIKTAANQVKIDKSPPLGTIKINNDSQYTNSTSVTLTLSAQDNTGGSGLSQMQFSNDNITWSTPEAYATTKSWILTTGDATKTVYAKFKDVAGNWSTAYSDTIVLDTTPPTTADSGIDGLWHNSSVTITLTASDSGSGIDKTYYSTDGSNPTIIYTSPFSLTNDGTYTIKYYSQDKVGNSESVKTATNQVKIDKSLPTGAIKINNDAQYTNLTTVTLTLSAQDEPGGSGLSQMQFSNDNLTWSTPETYAMTKSWTLASGDGEKTVYVKFKDVAGNWSQSYSDTITLDTTPPDIFINPVISPTNQNVTLSYSATDNFTPTAQIVITGDKSPYINEGSYSVTLTASDLAGNSSTASISFIIDKTAPVVIITSPSNGAVVEDAQIQLQGTIDGIAFSETRNLVEGENVLTKTATDAAGNSASASVTVYLYLGQLIGPEGGEVFSADGKVKVVIPTGALNEPTQIKVLTVSKENLQSATPTGRALLSVVQCKPYGLIFNKPVAIIYTLYQAEIPGTPVELGFYDALQKKIISTGQTSTVPADGYTVTFSVMHFSTYAALKNLIPQSTPIGSWVKIPLPDMLTGAFSQAIPITIPPGRKGIQPNLALVYRSSNSNSWVGLGFSLNPGYIVRSTRLGPPTYIDTQDTFYFITDAGTTELVHLIDNLYQAKIESAFTKFFKESDDSWKVVGKDGSVLRFGSTSDSKETSNQGTFAWYLTKAIDTNRNYIDYNYTKDQGKSYLSRIDYTGNEMGISPTNSVDFFLESRDDVSSSYISSSRIVTAKRLKEIQVKVKYDLVWRYELNYAYSPDTNRSLLNSITQYASDNKTLPTQKFSYQKAK